MNSKSTLLDCGFAAISRERLITSKVVLHKVFQRVSGLENSCDFEVYVALTTIFKLFSELFWTNCAKCAWMCLAQRWVGQLSWKSETLRLKAERAEIFGLSNLERKLMSDQSMLESAIVSAKTTSICKQVAELLVSGMKAGQILHLVLTQSGAAVSLGSPVIVLERLSELQWSVEVVPGYRRNSMPNFLSILGWTSPDQGALGRRLVGPHLEGHELTGKTLADRIIRGLELACLMHEYFEDATLVLLEDVELLTERLGSGLRELAFKGSFELADDSARCVFLPRKAKKSKTVSGWSRNPRDLSLVLSEAAKGRVYLCSTNHRGEPRSLYLAVSQKGQKDKLYRWLGSQFVLADSTAYPTIEGRKSRPAFPGGPSLTAASLSKIADLWPEVFLALGVDFRESERGEGRHD